MPSLFKRSNRIYYISYYVDGRRRWKSTGESQKYLAIKALTKVTGQLFEPPT